MVEALILVAVVALAVIGYLVDRTRFDTRLSQLERASGDTGADVARLRSDHDELGRFTVKLKGKVDDHVLVAYHAPEPKRAVKKPGQVGAVKAAPKKAAAKKPVSAR